MTSLLTHQRTHRPAVGLRGGVAQQGHFTMKDEPCRPTEGTWQADQVPPGGLVALSSITFSDSDASEIFRVATATVDNLAPCQVEACYQSVDAGFVRFPPYQPAHR